MWSHFGRLQFKTWVEVERIDSCPIERGVMTNNTNVLFVCSSRGIMSDKSELKAELERKKQRLAQIREEKKRKEEERKKKEVTLLKLTLICFDELTLFLYHRR